MRAQPLDLGVPRRQSCDKLAHRLLQKRGLGGQLRQVDRMLNNSDASSICQ